MNTSVTMWDIDPERIQLMGRFFNDLNKFMSTRHGYKRYKCRPWVNKVDANCSKFSLTLGFRHNNSVGISSIRFREKRRGHCTALVEFIDQVSSIYFIPCIEFVSVLSEPMKSFVAKHQFINRECYSLIENGDVPSLDWYRSTPFGMR